jgi:serine/threonine protein kinase
MALPPLGTELIRTTKCAASACVYAAGYNGTDVAVKLVTIDLDTKWPHHQMKVSLQECLREAELEAKMLVPLRHPFIVEIYGVAMKYTELELEVMTVLELAHGSLEDLVLNTTKSISWKTRIGLCRKIAQGMNYMHSKSMYHRDLKPANVLITSNDKSFTPKVCDFGLAKQSTTANETATQPPRESGTQSRGRTPDSFSRRASYSEKTTNIGTPVFM